MCANDCRSQKEFLPDKPRSAKRVGDLATLSLAAAHLDWVQREGPNFFSFSRLRNLIR
jgi:hypothetical protein